MDTPGLVVVSLEQLREMIREEIRAALEPLAPPSILSRPASLLDLTEAVTGSIDDAGLETIGDVIDFGPKRLISLRHVGETTVQTIAARLHRMGAEPATHPLWQQTFEIDRYLRGMAGLPAPEWDIPFA